MLDVYHNYFPLKTHIVVLHGWSFSFVNSCNLSLFFHFTLIDIDTGVNGNGSFGGQVDLLTLHLIHCHA